MSSKAVLEAKGISMEFSGVRVLHSVSVSFETGRIYGIVGENGAGKSTLMKIISGFLQPVEGEIFIDGRKITLNPLKAKELGIVLIPQELNLVDTLRVYENIFLGDELKGKFGFLNKREMIRKTEQLIKGLGLDVPPQVLVRNLSPAQKQLIEIAKAVSKNARVLIMDEPTSTLSEREVKKLFELVRKMKASGLAVVFISHRLKEVKEIADVIVVLRDGRKVYEGRAGQLTEKEIAELMVGRELSEMYPPKPLPKDEVVFSVENMSSIDGKVRDVSFYVKKGEILGFYGLVGSGRTELMETIIGIRKKSSGKVKVLGREVYITSPDDAKRYGIVYLPEDRKSAGIIPLLED